MVLTKEPKMVIIYSPFGLGQFYIGKWDKPYSPIEMLRSYGVNGDHRFTKATEEQLEVTVVDDHRTLWPCEWADYP